MGGTATGESQSLFITASTRTFFMFLYSSTILFIVGTVAKFCFLLPFLHLSNLNFVLIEKSFIDPWLISGYSVIYTSLPIINFALWDRDLKVKTVLEHPELYSLGRENKIFTLRKFLWWQVNALYNSTICFFVPLYAMNQGVLSRDGTLYGMNEIGTVSIITIVFVVNLRLAFETKFVHSSFFFNIYFPSPSQKKRKWTLLHHIIVWGSIFLVFVAVFILEFALAISPGLYCMYNHLFFTGPHWFVIIICTVMCLLPNFTYEHIRRQFFPKDIQSIQ